MRTLVLALFLPFAPAAAGAADLLDVYALALGNDARFRAAGHALAAVREARPLARAALLPQVAAGAVYGTERTEIEADDDETGRTVTRTDVSEPHEYGLALSQVVFDRGAFERWKRAGDEVEAAEAVYRAAGQDLALRVAASYFDVLAARETLRVARAENEAVRRQLGQAEGRFRAGIAAFTDVEEARAQHDLTLAAIVEAERQLVASRQALAEITGADPPPLDSLREEIPLPMPDPEDPAAWVRTALDQNPELLAERFRAEAFEHDLEIGRSGHLPTVRVEGSQTFGRSSGFNQGDFDIRGVFVRLDLPLFEGLGTVAETRRARSLLAEQRALVEERSRSVERLTRDAFLGVTSGAARVRALRQAVRSNRVATEASEAGLRVGTRTIVDVLNAQRLLFQAERDHARARYDYLLSVLGLKRAAGRLEREDLAQVNALFGPAPDDASDAGPQSGS